MFPTGTYKILFPCRSLQEFFFIAGVFFVKIIVVWKLWITRAARVREEQDLDHRRKPAAIVLE